MVMNKSPKFGNDTYLRNVFNNEKTTAVETKFSIELDIGCSRMYYFIEKRIDKVTKFSIGCDCVWKEKCIWIN